MKIDKFEAKYTELGNRAIALSQKILTQKYSDTVKFFMTNASVNIVEYAYLLSETVLPLYKMVPPGSQEEQYVGTIVETLLLLSENELDKIEEMLLDSKKVDKEAKA